MNIINTSYPTLLAQNSETEYESKTTTIKTPAALKDEENAKSQSDNNLISGDTVNISEEAKTLYSTDQGQVSSIAPIPLEKQEQNTEEKLTSANEDSKQKIASDGAEPTKEAAQSEGSATSTGTVDTQAETLKQLNAMLKEAQQRLTAAQEKLTEAMKDMNSDDEAKRTAAQVETQAAQILVTMAQSEVSVIAQRISEIMKPKKKE